MSNRNVVVSFGLIALIYVSFAGCSDDSPTGASDSTAPRAVTDLHVVSIEGEVVTLAWTAPGDDGATGTASVYDMRYSADPITEGTWGSCTEATTEPTPAAAGTEQSAVIDTGSDSDVYFALKAADEASNWSGLSNVVIASIGSGFVVRQLTSDGHNDHPCVDRGFVVWIHYTYEDGDEIYIANLESDYPTPTRLTDNGGEKEHPDNYGSEHIVWAGREGGVGDWEIWVYDFESVPRFAQFTDNEIDDRTAVLAGAGSFAWLQGGILHEAVHYWNATGHIESVLSSSCCPTTQWSNHDLTADDYTVVWRSWDRVGSEPSRAYLWDGTLTDISDDIEANATDDYSLHAGGIACEYAGSPTRLKFWDGVTLNDVAQGYAPCLYSGTIAFEVWDGYDYEICYWDGSTVHQITDNTYNDTQASIYGTIIAWVGRAPGSFDNIFYIDVAE